MSFWQNLPKPIIGLAPMDGVTDYPFRKIVSQYGPRCDLFYTEFVHVKALFHGKIEVFRDLVFDKTQKPIIAQLFGCEPDYFRKAATLICALGFDGIDINMGCPAKNVIKRDGGAALIKNPKLAQEIIQAVQKGIEDWVNGKSIENLDLDQEKIDYVSKVETCHGMSLQRQSIPISVKTRLGYEKNIISDWINYLIEAKPDAITVHGRTFAQLYTGSADWDAIASVSDTVKKAGISYLGNGDIQSCDQAVEFSTKYNLDGVLIGRAALGNPWIFNQCRDSRPAPQIAGSAVPTIKERFAVMLEHARYFDDFYQGQFFYAFRKHLGWYCKGFANAKTLRIKLMQCENLEQLEQIIKEYN